jgi:hypothetical protein
MVNAAAAVADDDTTAITCAVFVTDTSTQYQ